MKLVYGTTNQAKLKSMKEYVEAIGIEIIGLNAFSHLQIPSVDETGNDPLENARIKALAYYEVTKMPVFSCDSGLYIEGIEDSLQPGVHVRNVNGQYLDDDQMIAYYSGIAKSYGGQCVAQYKNAICLVLGENEIYEYMGEDISGEKFMIASRSHEKREKGFPLDSLSVEIETGNYYFDIDSSEESSTGEGFRNFFSKVLHEMNRV
ncbi:MAG: non-canonical purine NTP pyrophosphatase [Bacillaceae bacterium]